jgi:N-acetylglucosaminyldiphosphoundecaprenol N-acetyl-beta-D-mannosaminyltransferase
MQDFHPRKNILGVDISAINLSEAIQQMASWIEEGSRRYVSVCNVHTVIECRRDRELRRIINGSGMATPDGMPLVWACRRLGNRDVTRVCGSDLMLAFCEYSVTRGYSHFFYGGATWVAQELASDLQHRFPGLKVAGAYTPPLLELGSIEQPTVIKAINDARPDVVWVGLGTPKQDYWVDKHRPLLNAPVLVPVGAAFDFHTGRVSRAPIWMQRMGLEWLFRLSQEPGRLAYRYLVYNSLFVLLVFSQVLGIRRYT